VVEPLTDCSKLKYLGPNVKIFELAKIVHPEVVCIGEGTQIDDFCLINGGQETRIGRFNHIASFVSIIGGGKFIAEDYVGIAAGARIITGTDHYGDGARISPLVPLEQRHLILGTVYMEKDVFIGTNVVVHPNVRIGEGAIVGSNSLVTRDIEPWTINVGSPCRVVGTRPKIKYP
jgi:acetyltransferase-like isoleucine patch superfamily enzyme